jgi:hypothetical protein
VTTFALDSIVARASLVALQGRHWQHGRWSHSLRGPDDWVSTWNEGGRWFTASLWRHPPSTFAAYRAAQGQPVDLGGSVLRLWFGLHVGKPLVVGLEIQLPVPTRLLDWIDP